MYHCTVFFLFMFALALIGCQSQDPFVQASRSIGTEEFAEPQSALYAAGFSRSDLAEPPKPVADYFAAAVGELRFPYYAEGVLTFAINSKEAALVSIWMSAQEGNEPDVMRQFPDTDWYWISYKVPSGAEIRYHFNVRTRQEKRMALRDPLNPAVSADAPYESLWSAEAGINTGRLEYLEVPYDLPGRKKPAYYKPPANRKLLVYVPPAYDSHAGDRYPVIYMQDGQNAWDSSTANYGSWKTDRIMDRLIGEGRIRRAIVVSIFNTNYRSNEYAGAGLAISRTPGASRSEEIAAYYRDWAITVLKPLIDGRYRTLTGREDTGVLGSSYAGAMAIYWSLSRPDVFGFAGALSYAPGDDQNFYGGITSLCRDQYLPAMAEQNLAYPRIWLDCGLNGLDKTLAPFASALDRVLQEGPYTPGPDYHFELFPGASHNEADWYRRLPAVLEFLLRP